MDELKQPAPADLSGQKEDTPAEIQVETQAQVNQPVQTARQKKTWIYEVLLIIILLMAAYFRLSGMNWDEGTYLHPDERFLVMVESAISPYTCRADGVPIEACPPEDRRLMRIGEYFDTARSNLNPHNRGYGFFVYGSFPIFIVRFIAEFLEKTAYGNLHLVGRPLSALADLGIVFVIYLIATRLYDRRVGLLGAAFSAMAVMQIQQSHFFTVDNFVNFFTWLTIYVGALIATAGNNIQLNADDEGRSSPRHFIWELRQHPLTKLCVLFGLGLGMAVASKVSSFPVAFVLPVAIAIYFTRPNAGRIERELLLVVSLMVLAAMVSLVTFRILQPYAFEGPGFFGVGLNEQWMDNMRSLSNQVKPDSGFPPSVQWYDRPVWFSGQNLVLWGIGIPMALLAWSGFFWMAWQTYQGKWRKHLVILGWTGLYFAWQSLLWNPTMRYQLPVYPGLAIMAGWILVALWDRGREGSSHEEPQTGRRLYPAIWRYGALLLGTAALAGTFLWAYGFSEIYNREITRIASSRWIYQNIPGPINLIINTGDQVHQQPVSFPYGGGLAPGVPFDTSIFVRHTGSLEAVTLGHVTLTGQPGGLVTLRALVFSLAEPENILAQSYLTKDLGGTGGDAVRDAMVLDQPVELDLGENYGVRFELFDYDGGVNLCAPVELSIASGMEGLDQIVLPGDGCQLSVGTSYELQFTSEMDGLLYYLILPEISTSGDVREKQEIRLEILRQVGGEEVLAEAVIMVDPQNPPDVLRNPYTFNLNLTVPVQEGEMIGFRLSTDGGRVILNGAAIANETSWDDGQPMRIDGYDGYGGIYQGGLNFEMYWPDNQDKYVRIVDTLERADMVTITSSRQWGSLPRLEEKYPLVITYYRNLLGCPEERSIEWCYNVAEPGMFQGSLGFELVRIFQSNPVILGYEINDQFAEEAFTVYDHPKVFVFQKTSDYNYRVVREILAAGMGTGLEGGSSTGTSLLLPPDRLEIQRSNGTWSELFNQDSPLNRWSILGVLAWYLVVFVLGWVSMPLLRLVFGGLPDYGYPLARTFGLLVLSYFTWLAGSFKIPFTALTISVVFIGMLLAGGILFWPQRKSFIQDIRGRLNYIMLAEIIMLAAFLFFLLIRAGNPDLWHPWKGGEKPMDFSYFNAVLKSTTFPPYDPWYAGGYINYYYYGFVFVGVLTKWLGITPAVAYNLAIPTLYMMVVAASFSIGWNLVAHRKQNDPQEETEVADIEVYGQGKFADYIRAQRTPFFAGLAASLGVALLGNLGTVKMIVQGYQRLAARGLPIEEAGIIQRWIWGFQGFFQSVGGESLPYSLGDWYWLPSRAIPAIGEPEPITEFPFFTFIYADMHPHMIAMPIALLALGWALSLVFGKNANQERSALERVVVLLLSLFVGGLAIGALRPTNTWDLPTYLAFGLIALLYAAWTAPAGFFNSFGERWNLRLWIGGLSAGVLILWTILSFQPYAQWYALGYSDVGLWKGTHTPIGPYLMHWGLFLFLIVSWMTWQTKDWMAKTPLSALQTFLADETKTATLAGVGLIALILWIAPSFIEVEVGWLVVPLMVWAGLLLLRPGLSDPERVVLFMVGTGLFLTLMVEVIVLSGDIGRMNTVFKFYLQVWLLFGISAAVSLVWILGTWSGWYTRLRRAWIVILVCLVFAAGLYPLLAGTAKLEDRMAAGSPTTLDGMAFIPLSSYGEQGRTLTLDEDYLGILWMQQNVIGSPVIVEANTVEYRWGSRYTMFTGLPGVVGWNWHQRQQRGVAGPEKVEQRVDEVRYFYQTTEMAKLRQFLDKYDVAYIVVGQLERAFYDGPGIEKFDLYKGQLWQEVFRDGQTVIYEVIGHQASGN